MPLLHNKTRIRDLMIRLVNIKSSTEIIIIYASKLSEDYEYDCHYNRYCEKFVYDECLDLPFYLLCELRKCGNLPENTEDLFNLSIYNILKFHGNNKCI